MKLEALADADLNARTATETKRILILGGGFAGAYAALHLEKLRARSLEAEIVLVARENFVLFTPMLHEVAASDVSVTDVVQPLRKILRHTHVVIADIESIDLAKKQVRIVHHDLERSFDLSYNQLVLAVGAVTNFYHTPGIEEHALSMKTLGDAILVRNRIIEALELADNQRNETERGITLTVVVAGGGFAGVETVGAVNDLLREVMKFYPNLNENMLRVVLIDRGQVILPELSESLGRYAQKRLAQRGVEIRSKTAVTSYNGKEVVLDDGTTIPTRMFIWAAGITTPQFLSGMPCSMQRAHILTNDCLQVPDWPGVWALGDCALVPDLLNPGKFCPPTAQHATRQAAVLASNIVAVMNGQAVKPFKFKTLGMLAAIGRRTGVAEILGLRFSGIVAWWLWRAIYLGKLPGFQKKVRVTIDWILDLIFSKDIVQLPTMRSQNISEPKAVSAVAPSAGELPIDFRQKRA